MKNKRNIILAATAILSLCGIGTALMKSNSLFGFIVNGELQTDYTLTIEGGVIGSQGNSGSMNLVTDSTKDKPQKNYVKFNYSGAVKETNDNGNPATKLEANGNIANDILSPINSMKKIEVIGIGIVKVSWGWKEGDDIKYYGHRELYIDDSEEEGRTADFVFTPNYFKIEKYDEEQVSIEQIVVTYDKSCTLAENPHFSAGGIKFIKLADGTAQVNGFSGEALSNLVIPATVNGVTITRIDSHAFLGNETITSVTIPNTIKEIGNSCFQGCLNLATITFEPGGTEPMKIGEYCFRQTMASGELLIPARAKDGISKDSFKGMANIAAFRFEGDVSDGTYYTVDGVIYRRNYPSPFLEGNVNALSLYPEGASAASFTVPANVRTFERDTVFRNEHITSLSFSSSEIISLNEENIVCHNLRSINFNGTPVILNWGPLYECHSLNELVLPAGSIIRQRGFQHLGESSEFKVYYEANNINGWVSGRWHQEMGYYCKVYLLSEAKIPEANLPEHIAGSYHVVDGIKTIW